MHRTVLGHHDTSDAIKELEIIRMPNTQAIAIDGAGLYTQFHAHNPTQEAFIDIDDIIDLPPLSDGTIQRVKVVYLGIGSISNFIPSPLTMNEEGALNNGKFYEEGYATFFTTPVLIDGDKISYAQSYNELWGKKIKLISYTERNQSKDVGLFVSRPSSNVLDPVQARSGNLAFDSSNPLGSLRVLQTGTFQIQCKKTFMGKKGGLELLSDEQNRENVDYTKLYPFEVNQQEGSFVDNSPSNANTIMLGYKEGQEPITGNAFSHEFVQNVYCDYGTTTIKFDPPLPDNIETPHVSLHFAVANSSGHFHPWYANVTCTTGEEDYKWQYANSQHCVHMDTAWFRGKWSLRERTFAPFGTNLNNDYNKIDASMESSNVHIGGEFGAWRGTGIPTHDRADGVPLSPEPDSFRNVEISRGSLLDQPGRPFDRFYMSTDPEKARWGDDNQLGINLPRFVNPTMSVGYKEEWVNDQGRTDRTDDGQNPPEYLKKYTYTLPSGDNDERLYSLPASGRTWKETDQSLLGIVDPILFNAESGSPGQSDLSNQNDQIFNQEGVPPEGAVKGSPTTFPSTGATHLRVKPPYYDPISGKPADTLEGQGTPAQAISRPEDNGPQSYESSLSMNSPTSVWGGAFKSFAGMQGITYFANNTHMKIDAFMTPTHTPTPFETELVKTRVENPKANQLDWLGNKYLGDGTTPNQEFDEFGNIRKNVGIGVEAGEKPPHFKTDINIKKKILQRAADRGDNGYGTNHMTDHLRNYLSPTQSVALEYSWSNVIHRAVSSGYGLEYKEQLPRKFRTKYWDGSQTEYEWWPLGHANGHFTISYGTRSNITKTAVGGGEPLANTILSRIDEYDDRHHNKWNDWSSLYGDGSIFDSESNYYGDTREQLESQFLAESQEMGYDDEKLKIFRGHPVYMAACYGDYRPIAFIGSDTDSSGGMRGTNFLELIDYVDDTFDLDGGQPGQTLGLGTQILGNTYVNQLRSSKYGPQHYGNESVDPIPDQTDEWSPFWPLLNKGTRFPNQLPNTEGKGYPSNSQYEPGDAFLKTRTFQGQPTGLDSFWNSFSNNMSQYVSANTPYGEFYYADGGYAIDFSPYFNYAGGTHLYSAEKREQRIVDGNDTYRMMKLIPTDFNIQRQSLQKHNWNGGNSKAGVGTEGKRFGFGGAGSAQALGGEGEGVFDTYIGRYVVYAIEGEKTDV